MNSIIIIDATTDQLRHDSFGILIQLFVIADVVGIGD
jgi:hypothetical protein